MENQNPQPSGNPQQNVNPQQNPPKDPQSDGKAPVLPPQFVGMPEATNKEMTTEERLVVAERYVSELLRGYQMAGVAINRLENHLFAVFKILLEKGVYSFDEFQTAQEALGTHEDLLVYWGVRTAEEAAQAQAAAQAAAQAESEQAQQPQEK